MGGTLNDRQVYFLPRHGRGHRILPTELNHRANIWGLRSLGVRWIITLAVGSLKEEYHPRNVVLPDQFFDRTSRREHHTFFGRGIVGHVAFADPISKGLRELLNEEALKPVPARAQRRHLREHGRPRLLHTRRIECQPPARL